MEAVSKLVEELNGADRPISKQLEPFFEALDNGLKTGVSYSSLVAGLANQGITIDAEYLRTWMYRYRKRRAAAGTNLKTPGSQPITAPEIVKANLNLSEKVGDSKPKTETDGTKISLRWTDRRKRNENVKF